MKARAIARTVILATALVFGASCKRPLVEGPRITRTRHHHMLQPHPCAKKTIEGGLPSSCHILFQDHPSLLTKKITKEEMRSQILIYHVISDLIKNYGVRAVFFEGTQRSKDMRKTLRAKCNEKCRSSASALFKRCVDRTDRLPCGHNRNPCARFPMWLDRRGAEDFCLARIFGYGYHYKNMHTVLLMLDNPSVLFTGFERNTEKLFQKAEKYWLLLKLGDCIGVTGGPKMRGEFDALVFSRYKEGVIEPRNKHSNRDAVNEVILRSSQNTALVIGVDHKASMESVIRAIPFHERPTFYFIMPECQDEPAFSVSPEIIDTAAAITVEKKPKQNL